MTSAPKISVIIPVYNTEKYLRQCLDSVVNQTLKDIEIICINDGSTDNSLQILNEYANKDNRIVVINSTNEGAGASRNKGMKISHGKYVGFVDSDDWIDLNFYEELLDTAAKHNAYLVRTSYYYEHPNYQEKEKFLSGLFERKKLKKESPYLNVNEHTVVVWNAIYKQSYLIKNDIYFNNSHSQNDIFWTAKATYFSKKSIGIDKIYYHYRVNHNFEGQQLSLTTKSSLPQRVASLIYSNKITLNFINSVDYNSQQDYITAYKRCLWRYDDQFRKYFKFDEFTKDMQKRLFGEFTSAFNKFKCKESCQKESYYKFIKNNDFEGYVKSLSQKNKIIISLTSYPARINVIHKAILTLLEQTKKADKVILWLANEDFPNKEQDLPRELTELTKRGLTIAWCKDIKSYKKLIPTLKEYPEYAIVTADDDIYYPKDWLEKLYMEYIKQPNMVHCHRSHGITFRYGNILPYLQWDFCLEGLKTKPSFHNFPTSGGGILYPPHVFYRDILREDLFLKLLTSTDDIWFWAMCVLNDIKINVVKNNITCIKNIENTQETSLWNINKNNINNENLQKIFRLYPNLYKKIRKYTIPYTEYAQWFFCVYNENTHKVINIFGLRIKLRKERLLKFRKNITIFLENILCIKNDGIYKVIGIFRIKIKIKRKHKELLVKLKEQEKSIKNLKDEIKNIVLSQTQDFKKELINKTDSVKKQFSDTLLTHKDEIKNIVLSQTQDFKKELINICKNNEHLNYTQLESLFWLSKRLKIKNSLPPMRNWAMSPDVLLKLHEYITNAKPKTVLEFGSGGSTIVICDALSQNNSGRLISIEHLEKFVEETMEVIKNENLSSFLDLRLAQLKIWTGEHLCNEKPVFWYDEKVLDTLDLKEIDLLIIDGPPGNTNSYARYPALPVLYKNLSNKAQVWLDDTNRKDESEIAHAWAEKYKLIPNFFNLEKGLTILCKT
ncbi:MAG: glycosyltransferase [Endomicrobium sp.]|jgi:glycosyltransferase involved in cell wall biosynthesis|nr:glycosyltransferase [Endomicrobium sp.]